MLKAAAACTSLRGRNITLHTFRHTTAMHLLQAGVSMEIIALWLGHEQVNTTHAYIEADLDMKRKTLDHLRAPSSFIPGVPFVVTDVATPASYNSGYAVQDTIPAGWIASNINDGGAFVALDQTVQWGPFFDNLSRTLTYTVVLPTVAPNTVVFSGSASFDATTVVITGERQSSSPLLNNPPLISTPPVYSQGTFTFTVQGVPGLALWCKARRIWCNGLRFSPTSRRSNSWMPTPSTSQPDSTALSIWPSRSAQ